MFTKLFWKDAIERAISTAAQAAILAIGGQGASIVDPGWLVALGFAAGGFVLSIIKSLAAGAIGSPNSASFVVDTKALTK
jgi:hypothetical protein